jgi:hypothetical protein
MGTSEVDLQPKLMPTISQCDGLYEALQADPAKLCRDAHVLVIDDVAWDCDMAALRSGLSPRRRKFKEALTDEAAASAVQGALEALVDHARRLYRFLYPSYQATEFQWSFRNMVSSDEPLHFDTYDKSQSVRLAAFLNVSTQPRRYQIGPSLYELLETDRKRMTAIWQEGGNFALNIRRLTEQGIGPLGRDVPRHRLELAPESIMFFNPRTVSHELVYGDGAVSFHWLVPNMAEPPSRIVARAAQA